MSVRDMASKQYSDAEKIAYWRDKAKKKNSYAKGGYRKPYTKKSKASYEYKTKRNEAKSGFGKDVLVPTLTSMGSMAGQYAAAGGLMGGLTGPEGALLGAGIGGAIGAGITYFTGYGDYKVKENSFLTKPNAGMYNKNRHGGTVIRKTEYLGDLISAAVAGDFLSRTFEVNPGNVTTFPWLSQIAGNYEEWVCEGLYFEFRSMSGNALNSVNTALGSVCLSAQYNSLSSDFTNKQEMENHEYGMSCKPSNSAMFFIECARNKSVLSDLYVRTGPASASGEDIRFSDLCKFQIASTGLQGTNVNLGEIHVTYQICLQKSRMYDNLGLNMLCARYTNVSGITNASPIGSSTTMTKAYDNIGLTFSGNGIYFPSGFNNMKRTFWITLKWNGSAVAVDYPLLTGAGCSITHVDYFSAPINGVSSVYLTSGWFIVADGSSNPLILTFGTTGTVPTTGVYWEITQLPNNYV